MEAASAEPGATCRMRACGVSVATYNMQHAACSAKSFKVEKGVELCIEPTIAAFDEQQRNAAIRRATSRAEGGDNTDEMPELLMSDDMYSRAHTAAGRTAERTHTHTRTPDRPAARTPACTRSYG